MSAYAVDSSIIQRQSPKSCLVRVSTGSGSDLVCDQHAIFFDQVATAPCTDPIQVRLVNIRLRQGAKDWHHSVIDHGFDLATLFCSNSLHAHQQARRKLPDRQIEQA